MTDIYDILKTFDNNAVVIECGGHLGTDTTKLCSLFSDGTIHCFEANIGLYKNLEKLVSKYNNLKLYNLALSDENKDCDFFIDCNKDGDAGASSLLEASNSYLRMYIKDEKKVTVKGITLESFMVQNNIPAVDLLWLDVEGFEYYILKSSTDALKKIKYVYTEVNFVEFRKTGKLYNDVKQVMIDNGFEETHKWTQGDVWGKWQGNILFKNTNI